MIALFVSTIFWGSASVFMKTSLENMTPYYLLAFRFILAGVLLVMIFYKKLIHIEKRLLLTSIGMGVLLYFEFLFFTIGLQYTTVTKVSFIVGSYIILVPFIYIAINRKLPRKVSFLASVICLIGVGFVVLDNGISGVNKGDMITFLSTISYALHIVITAKVVKKADPVTINVVQIGVAAIVATIFALIMEPWPSVISGGSIGSIVYLAIGATIIPYVLSVYGQKYTSTTTAAIILSFECVAGCASAIIVLNDILTTNIVIGASLIVGSLIISEIGEKMMERMIRPFMISRASVEKES